MSLNIIHKHSLLLISIAITVLTVSSRPITTTPSPTTVVLTSSGGEKFEVQVQVALQSETIRQMIVDGGFSNEIVLSFPNITGETMSKVLEYCNKHVYYDGAGNNITAVDEMRAFDAQFIDVHYEKLFELFLAAHDLKIKMLYDIVGERIGDMMKGKTPEEIRNIGENSCVDDHPQQKELNAWAFQ
ncbi:hypothetical protein L1987_58345 [Smallanthus sonchifolius]|uniref:Uncharacterized protein n=1 Tax=Smallanthus sonchifolius TaxID=185202 RepID=A0ACB9DFA3_9ASTR|nr:hypothetical protein L1987_58345 [Smallanthus sonchifolius]